MHPSPRSLHATPSQPPCAHPPVWPQLPDPQRRQWHELLTQLLAQVIHGESIQEAYVSSRQSSGHQVRSHQEGHRRQYALAERARTLGFADVVTMDED